MKKALLLALAAGMVLGVMNMVYADGSEKGEGDKERARERIEKGKEKEGELDPEVLAKVRSMRRLVFRERHMKAEGTGDKEMEEVRRQIRETHQWLEKHEINCRKMKNKERCNLDPEVRKHIRRMQLVHAEMKRTAAAKEGEKLENARRFRARIMKALRKMHIEEEDLPEGLKSRERKESREERQSGTGEGDGEQNRERTRERTREQAGEGGKEGEAGLPPVPELPKQARKAAREAAEKQERTREGEEKAKGTAERTREEVRKKAQEAQRKRAEAREAQEKARREAQEAGNQRRRGGRR